MLTSSSKQGMYSVIPGDSVYSKNGAVQHTVTTGYGTDGRISSAGFTHGGASKNFGYEYHRGNTLVAQRTYTYDILGRPTARNTARNGQTVNDSFAHNSRSELAEATVSGKEYEYTYDNIGNRTAAVEDSSGVASHTEYTANQLNQYTAIAENGADAFVPQFDADGWDLTKNICEVFGSAGYIRTAYTYTPFGKVTASGDVTQPIQWSSEYNDSELTLFYYNYRHYHPHDGRWIKRDPFNVQATVYHSEYGYAASMLPTNYDIVGLPDADSVKRICDGYSECSWHSPENCIRVDEYPQKAKTVCKGFVDLYPDDLEKVACVASCLVNAESNHRAIKSCDERNLRRIASHVYCYTKCKFVPYNWLPEGGKEVGWGMLLPSTLSELSKTNNIKYTYPGYGPTMR